MPSLAVFANLKGEVEDSTEVWGAISPFQNNSEIATSRSLSRQGGAPSQRQTNTIKESPKTSLSRIIWAFFL
jgi:hypothetical protein